MQLYIPADVYADFQTWCYGPGDVVPDLSHQAWDVLQGQVFQQGLKSQLPYLSFSNPLRSGVRLVVYNAAVQRVCAVGLCEARSRTDWVLMYYFAISGARTLRVFEVALPALTAWLVAQAQEQVEDVQLQGEIGCSEDGCRWDFVYRATPAGRLWIEQDTITCG